MLAHELGVGDSNDWVYEEDDDWVSWYPKTQNIIIANQHALCSLELALFLAVV